MRMFQLGEKRGKDKLRSHWSSFSTGVMEDVVDGKMNGVNKSLISGTKL